MTTPLKSADHIEKILEIINVGTWAQDAIWNKHKDEEDYIEVPLSDRAYKSRGVIIIEQGRSRFQSTGKKLYATEADFWKGMIRHWPRFPLKKSNWKRTSRKKDGEYLVRNYELFVHRITAVTFEKNNVIEKIDFYTEGSNILIHSWSNGV